MTEIERLNLIENLKQKLQQLRLPPFIPPQADPDGPPIFSLSSRSEPPHRYTLLGFVPNKFGEH